MEWWKDLIPGTVSVLCYLSFFPICWFFKNKKWILFISSTQNSNILSAVKIWLLIGRCRIALATSWFFVPAKWWLPMTGGKKISFTLYFDIKSKVSYNFFTGQHTHQKNKYFVSFINLHTKVTSCFRSSEIKQINADAESDKFSLRQYRTIRCKPNCFIIQWHSWISSCTIKEKFSAKSPRIITSIHFRFSFSEFRY